MTNKEAIEQLKWVKKRICDITYSPESFEALELAIKALDERPQGEGDLISRTWLKEHKFTTQVCNGVEIESVDVVGVATIDNAPTVEYTFEEAFQKTVCEQRLYCPARPKGEWVIKSNGTTNYYACNKCGSAGDFQDKFCRECGADMRGGRE